MRLTLRTLLAYMDERLDATDARDMGHRIEESNVAMQVVNRIRDVTRRLRLGAPRLTGKQVGLDPNLVAEYLDNTLAAERIPEFEKVCLSPGLEADMHLAEVASCHQILALVLSSPADVSAACRQRMYKVGIAESANVATGNASNGVASSGSGIRLAPAPVEPRVLKVPDYLRETRTHWPWIAVPIAAVLLGFLTFAVLKTLGPGESSRIAKSDAAQPGPAPALPPAVAEAQTAAVPPNGADPGPIGSGAPSKNAPEINIDADNGAATDSELGPVVPGVETADVPVPDETDAVVPPTAEPISTEPTASVPDSTVPDSIVGTDAPSISGAPADSGSNETSPLAAETTPASLPAALPTTVPAAEADQAIGRMVTDLSELVAHWDVKQAAWLRIDDKQPLKAGERIHSWPSFRPKLTLSSGVMIELIGAARVELVAPDGAGIPGLKIDYGRISAMTAGKSGVAVRIITPQHAGIATFTAADSALGFDVRPTHQEGVDPETEQADVAAGMYVVQGTVSWSAISDTANGPSTQMAAPHHAEIVGETLVDTDQPLPGWLTGQERTTNSDTIGRGFLADRLAVERPIDLGFKESTAHRRIEVRSLSLRCLALLDEYQGMVRALADDKLRSGWSNYVESLRFAMALRPESARSVRETLERERPEDGARMYRLLWGFTRDQLEQDAARQLLDDMESESLDLRVLASWNMERISGKSFYQPDQPVKRRQSGVQRLRKMLDDEALILKEPIPGEPPRRPAAAAVAPGTGAPAATPEEEPTDGTSEP